jgi:hypothetical protein
LTLCIFGLWRNKPNSTITHRWQLAHFGFDDSGNDGIWENFIIDENALSTLQTDCEQQGPRLLRMGKKSANVIGSQL